MTGFALVGLMCFPGLWRNHDDAVAGGAGPWHKQARAAARVMYVSSIFKAVLATDKVT